MDKQIKQRLEYLRGELRAERLSYDELAELQSLASYIAPDDVELLEAAGIPEFSETTRMKLILDVTFETHGVPVEDLKANLEGIAKHAAGEGLITGDSEAEVKTWEAKVVQIYP